MLKTVGSAAWEVSRRMAPVVLVCVHCGERYSSVGDVPLLCPTCGAETVWVSAPAVVDGWNPSKDDRKLLKAFRINPA